MLDREHLFWDSFARFDSGWYFGIARYGYEFVEGGRSNLAFFPLYPLLMRYRRHRARRRARRTSTSPGSSSRGRASSWPACCSTAWPATSSSDNDAERAVIYAAVFPFAFFFGVVYSESLFLMLLGRVVPGVHGTSGGCVGGLAGAALSATRVNGILALPALAWVAWQAAGQSRAERRRALFGVALVPLGLAIYSCYVYTLSGSFLEWMHSITRWGYYPGGPPWTAVAQSPRPVLADPYRFLTEVPGAPYRPSERHGRAVRARHAAARQDAAGLAVRAADCHEPLAAAVVRRARGHWAATARCSSRCSSRFGAIAVAPGAADAADRRSRRSTCSAARSSPTCTRSSSRLTRMPDARSVRPARP